MQHDHGGWEAYVVNTIHVFLGRIHKNMNNVVRLVNTALDRNIFKGTVFIKRAKYE